MFRQNLHRLLLMALLGLLLLAFGGCSNKNIANIFATPTFTPTLTLTPTPTFTLTPTPTLTPTSTPTPTPTSTPFQPAQANTPLAPVKFSKIDVTNVLQLQEIAHYRTPRDYSALLTYDKKWVLEKDAVEFVIYKYPEMELTDRWLVKGNGSLQVSKDNRKVLVDSHWLLEIEQGKITSKREIGEITKLNWPNAVMSGDGKYIMVQGWEPNRSFPSFLLMDGDTLEITYKWEGGYRAFHGEPLRLSTSGKIAVTRVDNLIILWNVAEKSILTIKGTPLTINEALNPSWQIYISEDERFVVISTNTPAQHTLTIWDIEGNRKVAEIKQKHQNPPAGYDVQVDFAKNPDRIAIGIHDKVSLWNLESGEKLWETTTCGAPWFANAPRFSPSGKFLGIASCMYGEIWQVDEASFQKVKSVDLPDYYHTADFEVSNDGEFVPIKPPRVLNFVEGLVGEYHYLYSAQTDEEIILRGGVRGWLSNKTCKISILSGKSDCYDAILGKDFHLYQTEVKNGFVRIHDLTTGKTYEWIGHNAPRLIDSRYNIAGERDLLTGKFIVQGELTENYSPSEKLAVIYLKGSKKFSIFDLESRKIKTGTSFAPNIITFLSDDLVGFVETYQDKSVPVLHLASYIRVYNLNTGELTIVNHPTCKSYISKLQRISENKLVASCILDGADHLLFIELTDKPLVTDVDIGADISSLAVSPDGRLIAVHYNRGYDGFIGVYDTRTMSRLVEIPSSTSDWFTDLYFSPGQKFIVFVCSSFPGGPLRSDIIVYGIVQH
jgi:WD40 repeat protein